MNETINNIKSRRSTRVFLPDQIKDEEVSAIVEAAIYAPSAHNKQPWHFTVVQNKEILDELNAETKEIAKNVSDKIIQQMGSNEKFNIFYNAPTVIIISGDEKGVLPEIDCAAATENMLIAAESLGVGNCWVGLVRLLFGTEKGNRYKEKLGIPEGNNPYYAISLGYKKINNTKAPERRANTVSYIR